MLGCNRISFLLLIALVTLGIYIFACCSGKGSNPIAQNMANATNAKTLADARKTYGVRYKRQGLSWRGAQGFFEPRTFYPKKTT